MTHEPSAEERAAFAHAVNVSGVSADYLGGAAAGVASLSAALLAGLGVFAAAAGPAVLVDMVQHFIGKVAAGLTEELRGHETRLRTDGGEPS